MKKTSLLAGAGAIGVLVAISTAASAAGRYGYQDRYDENSDTGTYIGASAGSFIYKEEGLSTLTPTMLQFRFGQKFSPYLAVEGRVGTGINSDSSNGYKVNLEAVYGGYLKGMVPIGSNVSLYGLAGVGGIQLHRNYADNHSNDAGLSFGFGAEVAVGGGASLNAEWVRVTSGTNDQYYDYTADQLTFGVNWKFQ